MPPRRGTHSWVPAPLPWGDARLDESGTRLKLLYVTGGWGPADRADVRWGQHRITVTLSYMRDAGAGEKLPLAHRCAEVSLSRDASGLILIDGATGERAQSKHSAPVDPGMLRDTGMDIESLFSPTEYLVAREVNE